jgi:hypothetical protein
MMARDALPRRGLISFKSCFGWRAPLGALALLLAPAFMPVHERAYQPAVQQQRYQPADVPGRVAVVFDHAGRWLTLRALAQSAAGEVPRLEFASGCRDGAGGNKATADRCIGDEEKARAKLATEWGTFAHADRTNCTALARLGGGGLQSYVELLTCLEMAKDAKSLPKD